MDRLADAGARGDAFIVMGDSDAFSLEYSFQLFEHSQFSVYCVEHQGFSFLEASIRMSKTTVTIIACID